MGQWNSSICSIIILKIKAYTKNLIFNNIEIVQPLNYLHHILIYTAQPFSNDY